MLRRRDVILLVAAGLVGSAALTSCESDPVDPKTIFDAAYHRLERSESPLLYPSATSGPGNLPWGTAYALQALQVMLDKTRDRTYAKLFIDLADRVLALRDSQTDTRDFQGRSGSVWSVGDRYTVEQAKLRDGVGNRVFVMSSAEFLSPPDRSVVVAPQSDGTFNVAVVDTRNHTTLEIIRGLSTNKRDTNYAPARLRLMSPTKTWLTCQDVRTQRGVSTQLPHQTVALTPQRVAFAVHSGMIAAPLVEFYQTVTQDPTLSEYRAKAENYRGVAKDAWSFHKDEIRHSDGFGSMVIPKNTPVRADGCAIPHNQAATFGRLGSGLGRAGQVPDASASAGAIFKTLMADMEPAAGGGVTWPYNWTQSSLYRGFSAGSEISTFTPVMAPAKGPEDVSHGALDVSALVTGFSNNDVVTRSTFDQLQATYRRLLSSDNFAATVAPGGAGDGGSRSINLWAQVAPGSLLNNPVAVGQLSRTSVTDSPAGGQLLGVARLVRRVS